MGHSLTFVVALLDLLPVLVNMCAKFCLCLFCIIVICWFGAGIYYVNLVSNLDDWVEMSTFETCNVTYVEEVDCSYYGEHGKVKRQYYLYEALSERCGNQTLYFNEDFVYNFVTCKKGTSHRKDEGQHNCYVDDGCDEFIFKSTASYSGWFLFGGIMSIVVSCFLCLGSLLYIRKRRLYSKIASVTEQ